MLKLQMLKYDSLSLGVPSVFQPLSLILVLQDVSAQFFILPPFLFFFHLSLSLSSDQFNSMTFIDMKFSSLYKIPPHSPERADSQSHF